jgi:hypothetical protein
MPSPATGSRGSSWLHRAVDSRHVGALCWAAAGATALGCGAASDEGRTLGTDLGTFSVQAEQDLNECGPGAVGESARFAFDVELARADTELFWDGRIGGRIGTDLGFELEASVSVELRPARGEDAGCIILREDLISGVLSNDAAGEITAFSGEMRFDFAAQADSACTAEEQDQAQLPRLPCRMSYALSARRTRAPAPRAAWAHLER